jgi:Flp pilus assembly pilin Flp
VVRALGWRRDERGAVAVEFALVAPLLLLLLLGGIDWGYYFLVGEIVANAAREGARAGALVRPALGVDGCSDVPPGNGAVAVAGNYLQRGQLWAGGMDTRATFDCCVTALCTGFSPDDSAVKVTVTYHTRPGSMSLTGFLRPPMLPSAVVSSATMRREP